jgi:hypothetical protein
MIPAKPSCRTPKTRKHRKPTAAELHKSAVAFARRVSSGRPASIDLRDERSSLHAASEHRTPSRGTISPGALLASIELLAARGGISSSPGLELSESTLAPGSLAYSSSLHV